MDDRKLQNCAFRHYVLLHIQESHTPNQSRITQLRHVCLLEADYSALVLEVKRLRIDLEQDEKYKHHLSLHLLPVARELPHVREFMNNLIRNDNNADALLDRLNRGHYYAGITKPEHQTAVLFQQDGIAVPLSEQTALGIKRVYSRTVGNSQLPAVDVVLDGCHILYDPVIRSWFRPLSAD